VYRKLNVFIALQVTLIIEADHSFYFSRGNGRISCLCTNWAKCFWHP